jgi:hypothetical protein
MITTKFGLGPPLLGAPGTAVDDPDPQPTATNANIHRVPGSIGEARIGPVRSTPRILDESQTNELWLP